MVSVADVRRTCGIENDVISDADVTTLITEATKAVEKYLNSAVTPTDVIEHLDTDLGTGSTIIFTTYSPILSVKQVKVDTTTVSPKYVKVYRGGKLVLTSDAEETEWNDSDPQANHIKYSYGLLKDSTTETTTTAEITSPTTDYSISVSSTAGLSVDDYIRIYGMDGYSEVTKITLIGSGTITADVYLPHENGSIVNLQEIPTAIDRLIEIITSIMMIARMVGQSYTDIVGYGLEGFNVQKGEPYTQWREAYLELDKERQLLLKSVRPISKVV